jgi:hypothetical protein
LADRLLNMGGDMVKKVIAWFYERDWRTWLGHALVMLAALIASKLATHVVGVAVLFFYFIREANDHRKGGRVLDGVFDFAAPFVVFILFMLLIG